MVAAREKYTHARDRKGVCQIERKERRSKRNRAGKWNEDGNEFLIDL